MSETLRKKISLLEKYIRDLESYLARARSADTSDESVFLSIERLFQLMVDEGVDINAVILEKEKQPFPDSNQATFEALKELGTISVELHAKIAGSVGLRNRLVHRYETVQRHVLVQEATKYLSAYQMYLALVIKKYLL